MSGNGARGISAGKFVVSYLGCSGPFDTYAEAKLHADSRAIELRTTENWMVLEVVEVITVEKKVNA